MKYEPTSDHCYSTLSLLEKILSFKLDSQEFISNEKIISKIGIEIDRLNKIKDGHTLLSITKDTNRTLILILKKENEYHIFSWKLKESIEKKIDVEIHEISNDSKIYDYIHEGPYYTYEVKVSSIIVETLNGYNTNILQGQHFVEFCNNASSK